MHLRIRRIAALAVVAAGLVAGTAQAAGPSTLAWSRVTGLQQSTGNLYWTSFEDNEFSADTASVWRASKSNAPGQESLLYREAGPGSFSFGDIVWANPGTYYGYFAVNYYTLGTARIKRVALAGGTTISLTQVTGQIRDLDTDGTYLFWADSSGLKRMPIGGGAVTTLVSATNVTNVGLAFDTLFFTRGRDVLSMPKAGGAVTLRKSGASTITAFFVRPYVYGSLYYWGEANGSVKAGQLGSTATNVLRTAQAGRTISSVSNDGYWTLWTECATLNGNQCAVVERSYNWMAVVSTGGVGSDFVQADANAIFWGDLGQLRKYTR